MKTSRPLFILLLTLVLLLPLPSCAGKEHADVRLCIDLAVNGDSSIPLIAVQKTIFEISGPMDIPDFTGNFSKVWDIPGLDLEFIEFDENDPQVRLDSIKKVRDEIAAGKGPDVFMCACYDTPENVVEGGRLFPDVKQAMEEDIFLPLDDYYDDLELRYFCQPLLDGGKNSQGQQVVIPVTFSVPVTITADGESMDFLPDPRNIICNGKRGGPEEFIELHPDFSMEPRLDDNGEVAAQVAVYCAVNKNTACLDKALEVFAFFISKEIQGGGYMYWVGPPDEGQMHSVVKTASPLPYKELFDSTKPYGGWKNRFFKIGRASCRERV
mgnify:CR=1 FL=1